MAQNFEAVIKLGMANSRMKDFYDPWVMAGRFELPWPIVVSHNAQTGISQKLNRFVNLRSSQ